MAVSTKSVSAAGEATDRELVFTRAFDAPPALVFEAWTDPKHVVQWWGPTGFTTTIQEMDVRPGGVWRLVMHGPDATDYHNRIIFLEVLKPERLVYKYDPEKGSEPVRFQTTVTFVEESGETRLTMRMLFPSPAALEYVVKKYGAVEGANQTLGRLAEHLPVMAAPSAVLHELTMMRILDAPRSVVFRAWTQPSCLRRWWGPREYTNPVCEVNFRPGGAIRIHMQGPDGTIYPMTGTFAEIVEPERLVFTIAVTDSNGQLLFELLNTVSFEERDGKTKLTLRARGTKATPEGAPYLAGIDQGWVECLERLADEVKR